MSFRCIGFKFRLVLWLVTVGLTMGSPVRAGEDLVFLAYAYTPYYSEAPMAGKGLPGGGNGFVVDIVKAAYRAVGQGVEVRYQPMARSVLSLASGKFLGHIGSREVLYETIPKAELDSVNISYYYIFLHYFKSHFNGVTPGFSELSDLRGYAIANIIGSPAGRILSQSGLALDAAPKLEQGMAKLAAGRVDFWAAVGLTAQTLGEIHLPHRMGEFSQLHPPVFGGSVDLNFKCSHPGYTLGKMGFMRGLRTIRDNGTYVKILKSYFGHRRIPDQVHMGWPMEEWH